MLNVTSEEECTRFCFSVVACVYEGFGDRDDKRLHSNPSVRNPRIGTGESGER
jgi:hypothetical protein